MLNLNKTIDNYYLKVFAYFKKIYVSNILKKRVLDFDEIIDITIDDIGINTNNFIGMESIRSWFNDINDLHYLENFLDLEFEEIIVHSSTCIKIYNRGKILSRSTHCTKDDLFLSMQALTLRERVDWNHSKPFVSFHSHLFKCSTRVTLLYPSVHGAKDSFKIFIRKIGSSSFSLESFNHDFFVKNKMLELVLSKRNILVTGSTGSGKTALISSLLSSIDEKEHVVVLEDTQEINIARESFTFLLSNDHDFYTLKEYTQYALRMRPDRIILGEMRGPEIIPFMLAMNNGHKGLISSIHANDAKDGLERIALLFEMNIPDKGLKYSETLKLITRNIDYVVHMENKNIKEIIKVIGSDGERVSYDYIYSENKYPCNE